MRYAAYRAKGDVLIFIDADGANDPKYLKKMMEEIKRHDVVIVGPNPKTIGREVKLHDRLIFRIYYAISTFLFSLAGMKFKVDPLSGYRAIKRTLWDKLNLESDDFRIETEMNLKLRDMGIEIKEILSPFVQRVGGIGESKLATNPSQIIRIIQYILTHTKGRRGTK